MLLQDEPICQISGSSYRIQMFLFRLRIYALRWRIFGYLSISRCWSGRCWLLVFFPLCNSDCYNYVGDDDAGQVNTSTGSTVPAAAAVAVRRTSLQCPTSSSAARSKPPPPVRRTSSVTGTSPMLRSPTSAGSDDRWRGELFAAAVTAAPPGGLPSPSRARAIVDGRSASPRHAARTSPAPRRSLSSAYADLCQTLNDQLAAGGAARRPGGGRSSAVDTSTSPDAATAQRQHSANVGPMSSADTLLIDIKQGVCLRPTVSNDRSAPSIHRTWPKPIS